MPHWLTSPALRPSLAWSTRSVSGHKDKLKVHTRQANTSMAVFEDDIGAIARNVSQVRAFLAEATHGAGCKK